jgi:hypothetical protein
MATQYIINQGEDCNIELLLVDENGNDVNVGPLSANLVTDVKAAILVGTQELKKYALNQIAGYEELRLHPTIKNAVIIPVSRADSKNFPMGILNAVVVPSLNDIDYPNGRNEEFVFSNLGRIVKGFGKNL